MKPAQELELRRRIVQLIGELDAQQHMDRAGIEDTMDNLLSASRAAGWNLPTPNSRRS